MRKLKIVLLTIVFLVPMFVSMPTYEAKTLADLKKELADLEEQDRKNTEKGEQTEAQIQASKNKIVSVQKQIQSGRDKIEEAEKEIEKLNGEIKEKEEETKELVRFLQVANGENSYLEYVFGAQTMTDLINRLAIVEQLSRYNDELIEDMSNLIKKNEKLQKDLAKKEKELEAKIKDLESLIVDLGQELGNVGDVTVKLSAQIADKKETIKIYEDMGCKDDMQLTACSKIPYDTGFVRPISIGIISSEYGYRSYNGGEVHYGTDIATGKEGYNVYPTAAGVVSAIIRKSSCGGNMIFIDHIINGVEYTSVYMHLQSIKVKKGAVVYRDTVIGKSGGGPSTWGWELCSTGAHLHFGLAKGHYVSYSNWVANSFDARKKVYFPNGWFYSRY